MINEAAVRKALKIPNTTCQWCEASIPLRGPLCPSCGRFGTPGYTVEQLDAVAAQLPDKHRAAILAFEPRRYYGPTLPHAVSRQLKPHLARIGLLRVETHRGRPTPFYGLSVLGERLRERIAEES